MNKSYTVLRLKNRRYSHRVKKSSPLSSKLIQFPGILVFSALFITLIVGLESYLQYYYPERCLLSFFQKYNLLNEYKVLYQPNRGIWRSIGWAGIFFMVIMHVYSLRKRIGFMHEWGMLNHWMDFHIFCGIMGPVLVTFHTTFKFGGIVSIAYWSVTIVALSGLFGRYIFGFIPRGISGNELSMEEIKQESELMAYRIKTYYIKSQNLAGILEENITFTVREDEKIMRSFGNMLKDKFKSYFEVRKLSRILERNIELNKTDRLKLIRILTQRIRLNRKINFLKSSHRLLRSWHKFHIIFTVIIFLISTLHIIVYYLFRNV